MRVTINYGSSQSVSFTDVKSIGSDNTSLLIVYNDNNAPVSTVTKKYETKNLGSYSITITPDN